MTGRVRVLFVACALLLPSSVVAQGLGDAAVREKARRAKDGSKAHEPRTYTNQDLGPQDGAAKRAGSDAAAAPSPAASRVEPPPDASPAQQERQAAERAYAEEVSAAQQRLDALDSRIKELQAKLNPMSSTFIYGASGSNSADEELRVRAALRDAEAQLVTARQELEAATQALSDFRAGRRPAAPPRRD